MATKVYKSAMGRVVDMGALMLEGEQIRAVGNMNVNARGDLLDGNNRVVESKPKQVQKLYQKQISSAPAIVPTTSTRAAKKQHAQKKVAKEKVAKDTTRPVKEKIVNESVLDAYNNISTVEKIQKLAPAVVDIPEIESMEELSELASTIPELIADPIMEPGPVVELADEFKTIASVPRGGLAAAIAKTQAVKQELLKTPRQAAQSKPGVNRI